MSNRYKGAVISATPPTTSGGPSGVASGAWTLEQQLQLQAAGLWPSQPPPPNIEDVFSTYLYTGTGSALTITNGINLSGKGGLVWGKNRSTDATFGQNYLSDTSRGITSYLVSNNTDQQFTPGNVLTSANTTGFSIGDSARLNNSGVTYVSWTFREQAKFFDIVTYTGTGSATTVAHNLGSAPGCVIVKRTDSANDWIVWHRSGTQNNNQAAILNATDSYSTIGTGLWGTGGGTPDMNSSTISIGGNTNVNAPGGTFVAYIFAHNAGGFGLTGTDNVISCGSYTGNGSATGPSITLGYEPQWIMIKNSSISSYWRMFDNMRGIPVPTSGGSSGNSLEANTSAAEAANDPAPIPNATGFSLATTNGNLNGNGNTMIYIAIRRGPMAVPTVGTSVFQPAYGTGGTPGYPSTFTVDALLNFFLAGSAGNPNLASRLVAPNYSVTSSPLAETSGSPYWKWDFQTGVGSSVFTSSFAGEMFRRAPNFFDVVCYTGTGSATTFSHNLGVVPELMIVKQRGAGTDWIVYSQPVGNTALLGLNLDIAQLTFPNAWNNTTPTSSVFTVGTSSVVNASAGTYIAYLFATCPGVSKVGTYTGTGALLTVNCGFAAGARFVLIKRTDSTGDWYVYDSARGISSGTDPYYLTNTDAAQVTGTNYVDTTAVGFQVTAAAPAGLNANGGTYIFLAIA